MLQLLRQYTTCIVGSLYRGFLPKSELAICQTKRCCNKSIVTEATTGVTVNDVVLLDTFQSDRSKSSSNFRT